jgi:transposase
MREGNTTFIGMDVHKATVTVARLAPGSKAAEIWEVANEPRAIRRLGKKLLRDASGPVSCCYEAGACGYTLQRQLRGEGLECEVVAPSLVPFKPGERIKTDRRDARKLVEYWRSGALTVVHPPSPEQEAVRDLVRCREDVKEDLLRARHRLSKMLLRRGLVFQGARAWTRCHDAWLRSLTWEQPTDETVFIEYRMAIELLVERIRALDKKLGEVAQSESYRERVGWLRCFRGIDTISAMTILAELHGIERFDSPRRLMAYLGIVPGEHSSGQSERRTGITKTGNVHVRRILIEAAWHYRHRPGVGASLRKRREGQPAHVVALADRANRRLSARFQRLAVTLGKPAPKVVTAIARELAGFLWAALVPHQRSIHP